MFVVGSGYEVLAPIPGTEVLPQESVMVRLRFCGEGVGQYNKQFVLRLLSGDCELDTVINLTGRVIESAPGLRIEIPDKIDFGSVPVGVHSAQRDIEIFNGGGGIAEGISYQIIAVPPATADEVDIVVAGAIVPFNLAGGKRETFTVRMKPAATGLRQAEIVVQSEGGWIATVPICVRGVEPGIFPDTACLNFGSVRLGRIVDAELGFSNIGSFTDDLVELNTSQMVQFKLEGTQPQLPYTLRPAPANDRLVAQLSFRPTLPGEQTEYLKAITESGDTLLIKLVGSGLLERAETDVSRLDFTCQKRTDSIVVTNTGTWPLVVSDIVLSSERFSVVNRPNNDRLAPDESRTYTIEYVPGTAPAVAIATVQHTGIEQLTIELFGEPCKAELQDLILRVPDLSGRLDSTVFVPVELVVPQSLENDLPFRLQLDYEWSLLVPEFVLANGKPSSVNAGSGVVLTEQKPGTLVISGTLVKGTTSGTMVEIPMRVLLGRTYRTVLAISGAEDNPVPPGYKIVYDSGSFVGIDCDTSGTVNIQGRYVIKQNAPNPFKQSTSIQFEIARREHVRIVLYNTSGNIVAVLVDEVLDSGKHELVLGPETAPAGRYFYEIVSGRFHAVRNMLIVE